ncbi:MAG: CPBP family intramembrane metalloprotease [Candidatus Hydrogenedentes bacterium]|nr:CPBP family intramembrane metalloprotease [Candidatus Hydrogenedentota bacterium]
MKPIFWVLLFLYTGASVWRHARARDVAPRPDQWRWVGLQTPLLAAALWLAFERGVLSRGLFSPLGIAGGLAAGYLAHAVSLFVTNASTDVRGLLRSLRLYFLRGSRRGAFFAGRPGPMFALLHNSIVEEIIFRAVAQPLLIAATGLSAVSICMVAFLFAVGHEHAVRRPRIESFEFLAYSVLLGALYHWTGSLILVIVVHTVRNFELQYQQHLLRVGALRQRRRAVVFRARRRGRSVRRWSAMTNRRTLRCLA